MGGSPNVVERRYWRAYAYLERPVVDPRGVSMSNNHFAPKTAEIPD